MPAGASLRQGETAVVARRITGSMLREDRDGTSSLIEVEDRHPVVGDQSLELPRETLEEPARIELGRHRASPPRNGADDADQVDLNFRHAVIIRPHSSWCRDRLSACQALTPASRIGSFQPSLLSARVGLTGAGA